MKRNKRHQIDKTSLQSKLFTPMRLALQQIRDGSLLPETALRALTFTDVAIDLANASNNDKMREQANALVFLLRDVIEGKIIEEESIDHADICFQNINIKISLTPAGKLLDAIRTSEIRINIHAAQPS